MIADSTEELYAMVDRIGVQRKWIQYPDTYNEHFDISAAKKKLAIAAGAMEISARDYARYANARKTNKVFIPSPLQPIQKSLF